MGLRTLPATQLQWIQRRTSKCLMIQRASRIPGPTGFSSSKLNITTSRPPREGLNGLNLLIPPVFLEQQRCWHLQTPDEMSTRTLAQARAWITKSALPKQGLTAFGCAVWLTVPQARALTTLLML